MPRVNLPQDACKCTKPKYTPGSVLCQECLGNIQFCSHCNQPTNDLVAMAKCLDNWKPPRLKGT